MSIFDTRYHFVHDGKKSRPLPSLILVTRLGMAKVRTPGRDYRVGVDGQVGMPRTFAKALARAKDLLDTQKVGHTVTVRATRGDKVEDQVQFRKTLSAPPVHVGPGVEGIYPPSGIGTLLRRRQRVVEYLDRHPKRKDAWTQLAALDWEIDRRIGAQNSVSQRGRS